MANAVTVQTLMDGRENVILKIAGVLDTSDYAQTVLVDPATLNDMGPQSGQKASQLRLKSIQYSVEDTLSMNLYWDATAPTLIGEFVGNGNLDYKSIGGIQNNAGAGKTGKILLSTQGWAASALLSFECILNLGKQ